MGVRTTLVEPGFFRTEWLTPESTSYARPSINDYVERTRETVAAWSSMDGKQGGDPVKLADALGDRFRPDERMAPPGRSATLTPPI